MALGGSHAKDNNGLLSTKVTNHNYVTRSQYMFNGWFSHNEFEFWLQVMCESAIQRPQCHEIHKFEREFCIGLEVFKPVQMGSAKFSPNWTSDWTSCSVLARDQTLNQGSEPDCGSTTGTLWIPKLNINTYIAQTHHLVIHQSDEGWYNHCETSVVPLPLDNSQTMSHDIWQSLSWWRVAYVK
jgi:hypothetical protein